MSQPETTLVDLAAIPRTQRDAASRGIARHHAEHSGRLIVLWYWVAELELLGVLYRWPRRQHAVHHQAICIGSADDLRKQAEELKRLDDLLRRREAGGGPPCA